MFFQKRGIFTGEINEFADDAKIHLSGALYFRDTDALFSGKASSDNASTILIARTAEFNDEADIRVTVDDSNYSLPAGTKTARIVE